MTTIAIPQTAVASTYATGFAGQLADTVDTVIETRTIENAGGIDPGYGVVQATDYQRCKLPTAAADVANHFLGVSVLRVAHEPATPLYARYEAIPVLRKGRIWMLSEGTTVDDGPVYIVDGSGAGTAGLLRGDGTAATLVAAARVIKGASAGSLALVEFNLP